MKSAIDQLLLRNVDDQYVLTSDLILISDENSLILKSEVIEDAEAFSVVRTNNEKGEASNYVISMGPARANSPPTIKIIATESLVSIDQQSKKTNSPFRKMIESPPCPDENRDVPNPLKESELLFKHRNQETQNSAESSVDPLKISRNAANSGDEFININLLDNPNIRKSKTLLSSTAMKTWNEVIDDDSDIEILEDRGIPETKDLSINIDSPKNRESPTTYDIKPKDSQLFLNNVDNSDISNDTSSFCSSSPNKTEKYLTLEDIKHTGFTGLDLYICGVQNCKFATPNSVMLRNHMKSCCTMNVHASFNNPINFQCIHCRKTFQKIGFFMEHLEIHGLKRFGCSICEERYALQSQALTHMKMKHKIASYKLVPADPKNPSVNGLFVIQPLSKSKKKGQSPKFTEKEIQKSSEKESPKTIEPEHFTFSPNEIELLPRQAIYNREVQCAVCRFTTKVRTNIIRHLQLHAKDETVPESGPVNPVPCLDKREKMFDKMVNLASSSHQNGRMGGKTKEPGIQPEDDSLPKYVPENKRYVCGISECSYLTVNEGMLRYHLKALHSDEPYFKCTHCKAQGQEAQNILIDKMGIHLKMHDSKLYKCSHCNYYHFARYVVERHLGDKHPEKRPFVKVIREFESNDSSQSSTIEENEEDTPDPDGNHWKCNICEYKCVYKAEMQTHVGNEHDEKSQFKCTACAFKTNGKIQLDHHISSKHTYDPEADYTMVYQRIKGTKKIADIVDQRTTDEPFDTTPLWRRDMPRVKHIRGILIEEESTSKSISTNSTTPEKCGKRKSDMDLSPKLGKNKCVKPLVELDDKNSETGKYGPYGNPEGDMYQCTICNQFKTRYKHDMRDHLFRELKYVR